MSGQEKIHQYIDRARIPRKAADRYCMYVDDLEVLCDIAVKDPVQALLLAFHFGQAKGYRAAKAMTEA